jgi:hypothetical protein
METIEEGVTRLTAKLFRLVGLLRLGFGAIAVTTLMPNALQSEKAKGADERPLSTQHAENDTAISTVTYRPGQRRLPGAHCRSYASLVPHKIQKRSCNLTLLNPQARSSCISTSTILDFWFRNAM